MDCVGFLTKLEESQFKRFYEVIDFELAILSQLLGRDFMFFKIEYILANRFFVLVSITCLDQWPIVVIDLLEALLLAVLSFNSVLDWNKFLLE